MSFLKHFVLICHILYVGITICIFKIFHSGIRISLNRAGFLNGASLACFLVSTAVANSETNLSVVTINSTDINVSLEMKVLYV